MKFFQLVSEASLAKLERRALLVGLLDDPAAREGLEEARKECREIEVPEWATHFARIDDDTQYLHFRYEEIKRPGAKSDEEERFECHGCDKIIKRSQATVFGLCPDCKR